MELPSEVTPDEIRKAIEKIADKNCPKCYGRGYMAVRANGEPVICPCFKKNIAKVNRQ